MFRKYLKRIYQILFICKNGSLVFIEYEFFPYFFTFFEKLLKFKKIKYILDYDDAIFHNYDSNGNKIVQILFRNKIPLIAKEAAHIITGSPYLTTYFKQFNSHTTEIPTSIDFNKYQKATKPVAKTDKFIIGWLGTSSTSKNLIFLVPAFEAISKKYKQVKFRYCGIDKRILNLFENLNYEMVEWSSENEMTFLNEIDVGIMPLEDNKFNNGKCGFKLIQYMAMGKPTISTPLLANVKIDHGNGNLFATTLGEWINAFEYVIINCRSFSDIGIENKNVIERSYSIQKNYMKYLEIFKQVNF